MFSATLPGRAAGLDNAGRGFQSIFLNGGGRHPVLSFCRQLAIPSPPYLWARSITARYVCSIQRDIYGPLPGRVRRVVMAPGWVFPAVPPARLGFMLSVDCPNPLLAVLPIMR